MRSNKRNRWVLNWNTAAGQVLREGLDRAQEEREDTSAWRSMCVCLGSKPVFIYQTGTACQAQLVNNRQEHLRHFTV